MSLMEPDSRALAKEKGFRDLMPGVKLPDTPPTRVRQLVFWMVVCGFGLMGSLVFWAATAELTSAVVAPGRFNVVGDRLNVQHLEGGIVREINVSEGDMVEEGQVIAVLDGNRIGASLAILNSQLASLLAQRERLQAELAGDEELHLSPELASLVVENPDLKPIIQVQHEVFANNRALYEGQVSILRDRIEQLRGQLRGRDARLESITNQLELVRTEIRDLTALYEKGLVPKTRLTERRLQESGLTGSLGALDSDRENILERIGEMEERILLANRDWLSRITDEGKAVQEQIYDLRQRIDAAKDIQFRQTIRAPRSGRVVNLAINTLGQVLNPGQNVLEIVPDGAELILETRVAVSDIDEVLPDGEARVQLTAYSFRSTPPVRGQVAMIAADSSIDPATGQSFYEVHVRIPPEELAGLPNVKTLPGMPAQAMIETGRQTLADYLISPVLGGMSQAMKEGNS